MTGPGETIGGGMNDPRGTPDFAPEAAGVMPVVRLPRSGVPVWVMIVGVVAAGLLLFALLDARRRSLSAPAVQLGSAGGGANAGASPAPLPPLAIPPPPPEPVAIQAPPPPPPVAPPPPAPKIVYMPQPAAPAPAAAVPSRPPRLSTEPALVIDTGNAPAGTGPANQQRQIQGPNQGGPQGNQAQNTTTTAASAVTATGDRVRSSVFANPSTTVVQGTLVPAVLETALDSTRPGYARGTVSRDVRSFDGKNILIPRGTKLIGSYSSQVAQGQKRALISWDRLIRPDGVTIALGSPAADPQGGGGVPAKVDTHFFARFGGAILQSMLNLGVNIGSALATNAVSNTVVVLPNGTNQGVGVAPQIVNPGQITPTLTVKAGTSVSIFVARDLDFTAAVARK